MYILQEYYKATKQAFLEQGTDDILADRQQQYCKNYYIQTGNLETMRP